MMLASSGTSLIPEAGKRYLLNRGPCCTVLPLVVDLAVVETVNPDSEFDLRPKTNHLAPGRGCDPLEPLPFPLLLPPPFPFDLPFDRPPWLLRPFP